MSLKTIIVEEIGKFKQITSLLFSGRQDGHAVLRAVSLRGDKKVAQV